MELSSVGSYVAQQVNRFAENAGGLAGSVSAVRTALETQKQVADQVLAGVTPAPTYGPTGQMASEAVPGSQLNARA
jgi:hypothetical protein